MVRSANRADQRGLTIIGFLLVAAVIVVFAMVGFRVVPAYVEYFAVTKALQDQLNVADAGTQDLESFRKGLSGRFNVGYVESVAPADVLLTKTGNNIVATADWERRLHMIGNAYILLEFEASASR
jgi:Tfp pilus assembly protein PilE